LSEAITRTERDRLRSVEDAVVGHTRVAGDGRGKWHRASRLQDRLIGQIATDQRDFPTIICRTEGYTRTELLEGVLLGTRIKICSGNV